MLGHESDSTDPLTARKRSRRIIWGLVAVGCLAFVGGLELGRPLVGVGLYWACGVGFVAYAAVTDSDPYDERDLEIQTKAAGSSLTVAAVVLIAGAPGVAALEAANVYAAPDVFWGAMFALGGLFGVYAIAVQYHERQT
jgi:hypothetical protein